MNEPLVSVICLCYNHARFVAEAIESILNQSYPNIEIIIVDDFSTDESATQIKKILASHPEIKSILLTENLGNCRAFNRGLAIASGKYVVDFAADDVFLPTRIEKQVAKLEQLPANYGIVFTDAVYIDEHGQTLYQHFPDLKKKGLINAIPEGDIYEQLLCRYFVCSQTMLVKKVVFDFLQGYDETLAYEDFDFWLRSSRKYKYAFIDEPLTKVRKLQTSLSRQLYKSGDQQLYSTYLVCLKALQLNQTPSERNALFKRARYEFKHAVMTGNFSEAKLFFQIIVRTGEPSVADRILLAMAKLRMPLNSIRTLYQKLR